MVKKIINYLLQNKKVWLPPIILVAALLIALTLFVSNSILSPFIYALF